MAEDLQRSKGIPGNYKLDRGGLPATPGPYIGTVINNVDPARLGRLFVFIEEFGGDPSVFNSVVSYLPGFYGITPATHSSPTTQGTFLGNRHSYGMWFTPPDVGTRVLCIYASGDPNTGFYMGCIPEDGMISMIPAVGASSNFAPGNAAQKQLYAGAKQLPTVEINDLNLSIKNDPRYFEKTHPVHDLMAASMWQQGVINDTVRGPITSTSQRESPSTVYGISTPGQPVYQSGVKPADLQTKLDQNAVSATDLNIVGRRGGHTFVMDDGDISGNNALVRIRTSNGHQIMMNDSGNCIHIMHSNGQSWIELGSEGTLDIFTQNSVNVRSAGSINLHADADINLFAGGNLTMCGATNTRIESQKTMQIMAATNIGVYAKKNLDVLADGSLTITSTVDTVLHGGTQLDLNSAGKVYLATNSSRLAKAVQPTTIVNLPDTQFDGNNWSSKDNQIKSVVTRAPTHEPWKLHNKGAPAN